MRGTILAECAPTLMPRYRFAQTAVLAVAVPITLFCAGCSGNASPTAASNVGADTPADFAGQYSGSYRVNACAADGVFAGACEGIDFTAEPALPMILSLSQSERATSGTIMLGSLAGTFQGTVSGRTLTGTAAMADLSSDGVTLKTTIANWNTSISGSSLSGTFDLVLRAEGMTGKTTLTATILQLTR
jgi:hypothetical protein